MCRETRFSQELSNTIASVPMIQRVCAGDVQCGPTTHQSPKCGQRQGYLGIKCADCVCCCARYPVLLCAHTQPKLAAAAQHGMNVAQRQRRPQPTHTPHKTVQGNCRGWSSVCLLLSLFKDRIQCEVRQRAHRKPQPPRRCCGFVLEISCVKPTQPSHRNITHKHLNRSGRVRVGESPCNSDRAVETLRYPV